MRRTTTLRWFAMIPVLLAMAAVPRPASSQYFLDVYGGVAMTADDPVNAERLFAFGTDQSATRPVDFDGSPVAGARIGRYFDRVGVAFDTSYFQADGNGVENAIYSFSLLVMLRAQLLKTDAFPEGQFQPYLGIGPGIFLAFQTVDFRPDIADPIEQFRAPVGLDFRAGAIWRFSEGIGLFGEYRLTHFKTDSNNDDNAVSFAETHVNATLTTSHILAGLSFLF